MNDDELDDELEEPSPQETYAEIYAALDRAYASGAHVWCRLSSSLEDYSGYVLGLSRALVYLRVIAGFEADGFVVLALTDISRVRSSRIERFFEGVLRAEGRLAQLPSAPALELASIETLLASLLAVDPYVGLSRGVLFCVGRLDRVDDGRLHISCIRVNGTAEARPREIELAEITSVTFASDYLTMFRRHGDWEPTEDDDEGDE